MAEIENNAVAVEGEQAQPPAAEARRGRRRVEMKRMENEKNLQVTFCKRRVGLFKKASELVTLCGVEMALVIFSPTGKVYTFGNPSVDAVLERYSSGGAGAAGDGYQVARSSSVAELNARLAAMTSEVEAERKRGRAMNKKRVEAVAAGLWWEAPVETIQDPAQLTELVEVLENVKIFVKVRQDRITEETSANIAAMACTMYGNGGGGGFVSGGGQAPAVQFLDYKNDNINNIHNYNNTINNNNNNNNNNNSVPYPYYNNNDHGFFF